MGRSVEGFDSARAYFFLFPFPSTPRNGSERSPPRPNPRRGRARHPPSFLLKVDSFDFFLFANTPRTIGAGRPAPLLFPNGKKRPPFVFLF